MLAEQRDAEGYFAHRVGERIRGRYKARCVSLFLACVCVCVCVCLVSWYALGVGVVDACSSIACIRPSTHPRTTLSPL